MATRSTKPSAPVKRATDRGSGDAFGTVLDALEALRDEIASLRDEVRVLTQRRTNRRARTTHDPGDAVPPGVAVQDPAPLTSRDRKVKRGLERLPRDHRG
jgi:hypothetical protein